ncbi:MAG: 2-C-methyl-D-erythritol 2,4-cyclodiphosphate synthase [Planctomycetota bacterium]
MTVSFRIGLGYDSHRLGNGGPLRVGGMDLESDVHSIGHSDADVLLHAITDAVLGSVAEPDIGRLFSNQDSDNRDRDSRDFLAEAMRRLALHRMQIVNLDAVILAEQPKMAPHVDQMRTNIAQMLHTPVEHIGLKAKSGEGVDAVGHGEAIAARAVVLVQAIED